MKNNHSQTLKGMLKVQALQLLQQVGMRAEPGSQLSIEQTEDGWLIRGTHSDANGAPKPAPSPVEPVPRMPEMPTAPPKMEYKADIGSVVLAIGPALTSATIPVYDGMQRGFVPPRGTAPAKALLSAGGKWVVPEALGVSSHSATWTRSTGLRRSINGISGDIPISEGEVIYNIGYNEQGNVVYGKQPTQQASNTETKPTTKNITEKPATVVAAGTTAKLVITPNKTGYELTTIVILNGPNCVVRLPQVPTELIDDVCSIEFTVKCLGDWSGKYRVESADGKLLDGFSYRDYTKNRKRQPAKIFRFTGKGWILTSDSA